MGEVVTLTHWRRATPADYRPCPLFGYRLSWADRVAPGVACADPAEGAQAYNTWLDEAAKRRDTARMTHQRLLQAVEWCLSAPADSAKRRASKFLLAEAGVSVPGTPSGDVGDCPLMLAAQPVDRLSDQPHYDFIRRHACYARAVLSPSLRAALALLANPSLPL